MKNPLALAGVAAILPLSSQAVITAYDGIDYTVGTTLESSADWAPANTGAVPAVSAGSLTVSGLYAPTGNKVSFASGNIQEALGALNTTNTGTAFFSFAFTLTSLPTAAATYSFGLATGSSNFATTIWLQGDGTNFAIGLSNRSNSTPNYTTSSFGLNQTIFIVGSYQFNGGVNDDASSLWINPDSLTFDTASAPAPTLTALGGNDMAQVSQFLLRGAAGSPAGEFDELRVGSDWKSVTPVPEPAAVILGAIGLIGLLRRRR